MTRPAGHHRDYAKRVKAPAHPADGIRVRIRRMTVVSATAATVFSVVALVVPATAQAVQVYPRPASGMLTFVGRGFGHGIGMSQFGAEGMGRSGKTYRQIVRFYYPGTTLSTVPLSTRIRVHLSAAPRLLHGHASVTLAPRAGAFARVAGQPIVSLPTQVAGSAVTTYRVTRLVDGVQLRAISSSGRRIVIAAQSAPIVVGTTPSARPADNPALSDSRVGVREGTGVRVYRGQVRVMAYGSGLAAINLLRLQDYLYGVVGAEVPGGWTTAAYRAQAVAARSYALLLRANARAAHRPWDICDTNCQAYGGVSWEQASQNAAVDATTGRYLSYQGRPALAMFSSADGGYTVAGSQPYLPAKPDPYDGVVTGAANWGHAWRSQVAASTIEADWPELGHLRAMVVVGRDGLGRWGGRVTALRLRGTNATVVVSADDLRWTLGLKSTWWRVALPKAG
jgi:SpoIID/LytB domain protein